ncbi:Hsp33 family molecular chaperone HslO [Symbiobacterium thermophilum]|uniref:Heat-shock protein Hsp33 n=1 Tax=Symbiobacterium thermophilum (strain DSM 24528 / JCM 14929 / IAM 14863 / T) TaxID=292459 RepID=Q67MC3_SYMTH|nr:Hsp33 family molecular chaperone HslO [Symbiobacterium thermophilum]BAD41170.1 heat-shock protein Hsp33 [Symbiobacterium thermophilum IAM 14863]
MENYIIKSLGFHRNVRILFAETTGIARAVCRQGQVDGAALRKALATTVTAAGLLCGTLKDRQRLTLKVGTSRPGCRIFAEVDADGNVRGYLSDEWRSVPAEEAAGAPLQRLIGDRGQLQVIRDLGMYRGFSGITDMPYGNIVDDLAHYFRQSEQTTTRFVVHVALAEGGEVAACRGAMAQLLPGADHALLGEIEQVLCDPRMADPGNPVTAWPKLLPGDAAVLGMAPLRASCGCSREMFLPMLRSLSPADLREAVATNRSLEVVCHACGCRYSFSPDEMAAWVPER